MGKGWAQARVSRWVVPASRRPIDGSGSNVVSDLTKLTPENSNRILDIVGELELCTAQQVRDELTTRHGLEAPLEQVERYMEFLRSGFPRKLAHAGPGRWIMVDLG